MPGVPIVNGIVVGREGWLFGNWDSAQAVVPTRVQRTTALVVEACRVMKGAGLQVAVTIPPSRVRLYPDYMPAGWTTPREREERYGTALRDLRAAGIIVPDHAETLTRMRRESPATPLTFKADSHWTPEAAEAAADDMGRALRAATLPASSRRGEAATPMARTEHPTDLATRLPAADRRQYQPELFAPRAAESGGAASLLVGAGAAPPDVIVAGSSNFHPRYGYASRLSTALNRPVGLTWAVHNRGPYRTLLDATGSENFRKGRPRLIVWSVLEMDLELGPEWGDVWRETMSSTAFLEELRRSVAA